MMHITGSWSQEWSRNSNLGGPIWDVGVPTSAPMPSLRSDLGPHLNLGYAWDLCQYLSGVRARGVRCGGPQWHVAPAMNRSISRGRHHRKYLSGCGSAGGMRAQSLSLNDRACGGESAELGSSSNSTTDDGSTALGLPWTSDFSAVD